MAKKEVIKREVEIEIPSHKKTDKEKGKIKLEVNQKNLPEGIEAKDLRVVATKIEEKIIENGEKEKEKAVEEGKKTGFKAKYIIPIVLLLAIPVMLHTCSKENKHPLENDVTEDVTEQVEQIEDGSFEEPIVIEENVPFEIEIADVKYPTESLWALVNAAGQEGLTANNIEGYGIEGKTYSGNEHYEAESKSVANLHSFEQIKQEIDLNYQILQKEGATQEEIYNAAKTLLELNEQVEDIYQNNSDFAEEYANKFIEASEKHEDGNTVSEVEMAKRILENYKSELGLAESNVYAMQEVVKLCEDGFDIKITNIERNNRGDYTISGEGNKTYTITSDEMENMAKSVPETNLRGAGRNLKDLINDRTTEKNLE